MLSESSRSLKILSDERDRIAVQKEQCTFLSYPSIEILGELSNFL